MRNINVLGYIVLVSLFVFTSCKKSEESDNNLSGTLTAYSDCKNGTKSAGVPDNKSCAEYSFDKQTQLLKINHINAGFNCCPDKLYSTIWFSNDSIYIQESEAAALCRCNCLYDLKFEIDDVEQKTYTVVFIEPYAKDQNKLIFDIDLKKSDTGKFCVLRKKYPWGINTY